MKVSIVQADLKWEDKISNLAHLKEMINSKIDATDLIILPEMFSTGFSMKCGELAENEGGETFNWMSNIANDKYALLIGSLIIEENGNYYNRLYCVYPNGFYETYDKRHLFSYGKEDAHYTAGKERKIIEWKGWKICPLVCYDLRFPVWSRNTDDYDLLVYVANWPQRRAYAWKSLLKARAIENQSFTVGVNRVGLDGNELEYSGDSQIIDFAGNILFEIENEEMVKTIELDKKSQTDFRTQFGFLNDRDQFEIKF